MRILIAVFTAFALLSCGQHGTLVDRAAPPNMRDAIIVLQPLDTVPPALLLLLRDWVGRYYPVTVTIAAPEALPANAYYKPRNRYKADKILQFLKQTRPADVRIVVGITGRDISTKKGAIDDYGIMGLGYQPGNVCVVSTYRLKGDNPSTDLLKQRLIKTVLHEIGHNFGLAHCPNKHCIMADAEGKLNQDNETGMCDACSRKLGLR